MVLGQKENREVFCKACFQVHPDNRANFENANLYKADLREADGLTLEQLSKAKSLYLAQIDPELNEQLAEKYPDLIG